MAKPDKDKPKRAKKKPPASEAEKDRAHQEELLDEAVEETFPASDPIAPKQVD